MIGRILSGPKGQGALRASWTAEEAAEWVHAHLEPTNYHDLVTIRGWSAERLVRRVLETLGRDLFYPTARIAHSIKANLIRIATPNFNFDHSGRNASYRVVDHQEP